MGNTGNYLGLYHVYRCVPMGMCSWHSTWGDGVSVMGFALGCPGSGHLATGAVARLLVPQKASEDIPKLEMGNDSMTALSIGLPITCLPLSSFNNRRTTTRPLNSNPTLLVQKSDSFFKLENMQHEQLKNISKLSRIFILASPTRRDFFFPTQWLENSRGFYIS